MYGPFICLILYGRIIDPHSQRAKIRSKKKTSGVVHDRFAEGVRCPIFLLQVFVAYPPKV